ncbi:hypothetical protein K2173_013665 [Erythroxylum novogranatense]|uniref:Late embryogenesis abundant protein LEA-2 subgroup domain-containing protein n=1 Tax=Erythroxylum novogranatense TaxID=1862640 RepID=A0AAV8SAJ1_9ROSI|nr:hypothetical protein K2173_013665 [Erythroxylum novogranatense]
MASQSSQGSRQQPIKETGQTSDDDHPPVAPNHDVPGNDPPQVMGYPPTMGYPQHGYDYSYAQAPPASYYNPHLYQSQQRTYQSSNFARGVLLGVIFLLLFMCTFSVIMWLVTRPEFPIFYVKNFSVSNFNATPPVIFTANWDMNLTVENPNTKQKIVFDRIESFVFDREDNQLASSFTEPFSLETKASQVVVAKLSANGTSELEEGTSGVDKLAKERNSGNVTFSFRMKFWTTFKASWWARRAILKVLCDDMEVSFVGASGNGNLANKDIGNCLVFV